MLSKIHIISLLHLKGIARKTVFKISNYLNTYFDSDNDFIDTIVHYQTKSVIPNLKNVKPDDVKFALEKSNEILRISEERGISIITFYDKEFPIILKNTSDPPIILNCKGNLNALKSFGVAIIGTREPTENGQKAGEYFGEVFAQEGFNIVSGLAIGCDASAHRGAIKVKGAKMTAVLAHGLHNIYPKENEELGNNILTNNGLLISEYFVNEKANKGTFVERDRLQAGISLGTIVIQTGITGGTMYTVNETVKSKKMLAAVHFQKKIDSIHEKNQGNIKIIKEGAFALTSTNFKEFVNLLNNSSLIYKI